MRPKPTTTFLAVLLLFASAAAHAVAGGAGGQAQADGEASQKTSLLQGTPPAYPPEAMADCAHGSAKVLISVDAQGRVDDAKLHATSGNPYLDAAAVQATRAWLFNPKRVDGVPQASEVIVPVVFTDPCPMELSVDDPAVGALLPPPGWDAKASPQGWEPYEDTAARTANPPKYPKAALRACAGGVVQLRVTVAANGKISNLVVATSSGNADLDRAAVDAARAWRFRPGKRGELVFGGDVLVPVHFQSPC